ncbi:MULTISPECIES: hypothetical protein [unclassified Dehalobacter]|jgi:hypothetical protein|uniref:hypothetical protein n=1 Tax=unclassified Dehalobacter TaxID=2635733 RepID=UPI00028AA270|nr:MULTISPECIES: hypothetical protein [unclassified Dehalobacter]AFV04703.1 hypothetical protein DCF50_p696 [Dehalobacter sp. CF]
MFMRRGFIRSLSVIIPLVIIVSVCAHSVQQAEGKSAAVQEIPVGQGIPPEDPQGTIRNLCEENNLSYALVLAVYQAEGIDNIPIDTTAKSDIKKLAYYRNYWAAQGYADEFVFDLMLMSNHYGLEGCQKQMEDGGSADPDSYVQRVADFKYNLEQNQGVNNK